MFSRMFQKRALRVAVRPTMKAMQSPMWRQQAQAIQAALPSSKSFSTMLKMKQEEQEKVSFSNKRFMSTVAATKDEEEKPAETFNDIVAKYGALPLAGLLSVAAVSKEVYYLNAETLLLGNFCLIFFVGYVVGGDVITKFIGKERAAEAAKVDDIIDLQSAFWESKVNQYKSRLGFSAYLEDVKKKEIDSMRLLNEAQSYQARHDAHNETLKKLRAIVHQEYEAEMEQTRILASNAGAAVRTQFAEADAATRAKVLENAINDIGEAQASRSIEDCPIKSMFVQYLKNQESQDNKQQ